MAATTARLCEVCSKLDVYRLARPLLLCHDPLGTSCSTPPIDGYAGAYITLGSVDEIDRRRSACDLCSLVAECLDREPSDVRDSGGTCRIRESAQFCTFRLPRRVAGVAATDSTTHFHLTQASVIFDTSAAHQFHGPALPWEVRKRDDTSSHYILNLQTKTRCSPPTGDRDGNKHDITEARIPQTEQEWLDTVGGRYVGTQVDTALVRKWLRDCERNHRQACAPSLRFLAGQDKDRGPTFVVDVNRSCLVDAPPHCRYVALSYVWGTAPVFKHLLANTQELRKTGSLRSLPIPATIRDAVTLVRAIGEHYLWVDSICIIQDDLKMQQTEIMRMGSIYSSALFTIVAAAGDHANSGLPGVEPGSREQVQKVLKLADCELLTVIDVCRSPSGIDDTVWAQRAWTFQERVLSTRVLVFSQSQVYWTCRGASHSEERALEDVEDIERLHLTFPQKPGPDYLSWTSLRPLEYCSLYDDLLTIYRTRRLSYQTDILNAFNGVTEILAAIQDDTFFWGLPGSFFSCAMTWDLIGYCARNYVEVPVFDSNGSQETVPIPSWSWAAWSGKDSAHHPGERNIVRPVIQFSIVNNDRQLVRIKEPQRDRPGDHGRPLWQEGPQPHQPPSHPPRSCARIGQLQFWTSLANVRAVKRWILHGRVADYTLSPPPDFQPDPNDTYERPEIVHQDFIVIAGHGAGAKLVLLAIEWKDGVAYRVGRTEVREAEWIQIKNRQWRFITLG